MRLIDADELIKDYLNHSRTEFEIKNCCMVNENVIAIIDNAPTVEEKSYAMGYQDGLEDGLDDIRPQGEWIKEEDKVHSKCSLCGFKYADYRILFDFCPSCGANMWKEAEE